MRRHVAFDLCRTMLALGALYAFVLGGFVGAAQAAPGSSLVFLCGHDQANPDRSHVPTGHQQGCCVAGCYAGSGAAPSPAWSLLVAPSRVALAIGWRIESAGAPSCQRRIAFHPRGPPRV